MRKNKTKTRWATPPSINSDHEALRDYYETELFAADVDSCFTTDTGELHADGFSSAEVGRMADLVRALETLVRRPS